VPTKEVRYASILVPPLAIAGVHLAALWLERSRERGTARRHLAAAGALGACLGLFAFVVLAKVPSALPWGAIPAALALGGGVAAFVASRRPQEADLAPRRLAALALLLACASPCVLWPVIARYLGGDKGTAENRAVLAALEPEVPAVVLGSPDLPGAVTPDDLFDVVGRGDYARSPDRLPTRAAAPRLSVVTLETQADTALAARGEGAREVLRRTRSDGRTLIVLRFGPP
jgi:hypothetical protein